ncbi:GntR family transcriptional regulator [Variovorax sp. LjRoot290]|uniref:GntR family transcriptional regulator n=1 Tax=Variovorax sp. LjRoot290 TaxID=3342316 RepID=UPI003ECEA1F8
MEIGAKLPSEAELGEQYGISRIVAREALAALVRSGSMYKIKGRGVLVNRPASATRIRVDRSGFADEMWSARGARCALRC